MNLQEALTLFKSGEYDKLLANTEFADGEMLLIMAKADRTTWRMFKVAQRKAALVTVQQLAIHEQQKALVRIKNLGNGDHMSEARNIALAALAATADLEV